MKHEAIAASSSSGAVTRETTNIRTTTQHEAEQVERRRLA